MILYIMVRASTIQGGTGSDRLVRRETAIARASAGASSAPPVDDVTAEAQRYLSGKKVLIYSQPFDFNTATELFEPLIFGQEKVGVRTLREHVIVVYSLNDALARLRANPDNFALVLSGDALLHETLQAQFPQACRVFVPVSMNASFQDADFGEEAKAAQAHGVLIAHDHALKNLPTILVNAFRLQRSGKDLSSPGVDANSRPDIGLLY